MSLFSYFKTRLSRFASQRGDRPQPEPEKSLDIPSIPALDQGMPIEVMKDFDAVLFFGRLAAGGAAELTVERVPGERDFPVCRNGSAVLVRGYDVQTSPVLLLGRVAYSSGARCTVGMLRRIPYETSRQNVRYPLTPPAGISVLEEGSAQPQPCRLLNISVGGACIVTERAYQAGWPLRLQIGLTGEAGRVSTYPCRVVRAAPRSGDCFEYGLSFTPMGKADHRSLVQDIQAIRRGTEKRLLL